MSNEVTLAIVGCLVAIVGGIAKWVISTAKLTAKVATDSIARSEQREKEMLAESRETKAWIQGTLIGLVQQTNEVAVNATNALRENSLIHQSTKETLRQLIKATEHQTTVIESTAKDVATESKKYKRGDGPLDHGGNIH